MAVKPRPSRTSRVTFSGGTQLLEGNIVCLMLGIDPSRPTKKDSITAATRPRPAIATTSSTKVMPEVGRGHGMRRLTSKGTPLCVPGWSSAHPQVPAMGSTRSPLRRLLVSMRPTGYSTWEPPLRSIFPRVPEPWASNAPCQAEVPLSRIPP